MDRSAVFDPDQLDPGRGAVFNDPRREMEKEAASAGVHEMGGRELSNLQILTAMQV